MTLQIFDHILKTDMLHWHRLDLVTVTAALTLSLEEVILCDASGGAFTVTLPPAASHIGRMYRIMKTDSSGNAVTVDGDGSELIDLSTTVSLASQLDNITIVPDGTQWFTF